MFCGRKGAPRTARLLGAGPFLHYDGNKRNGYKCNWLVLLLLLKSFLKSDETALKDVGRSIKKIQKRAERFLISRTFGSSGVAPHEVRGRAVDHFVS
jgi:hypothetical protein